MSNSRTVLPDEPKKIGDNAVIATLRQAGYKFQRPETRLEHRGFLKLPQLVFWQEVAPIAQA
jgi:hypothetical protein